MMSRSSKAPAETMVELADENARRRKGAEAVYGGPVESARAAEDDASASRFIRDAIEWLRRTPAFRLRDIRSKSSKPFLSWAEDP